MNEYVKGLMKAVRITRADMEAARREYDAAVQELLCELDKCAREDVEKVDAPESGQADEKGRGNVCGRCGYRREPGATVCRWCVGGKVKEEKGRESVGPHTNAGKVEGCACYVHQPVPRPGCVYCVTATHHATQHAQVLGNKEPDTTSHG